MGYYGITGWSGGGRRPINYGLKAGQFRTGKYNVFQNKTVINNNIFAGGYMGGYNYGYFDHQCHQDSTPSWMNWLMGIGIGASFLGGILSLFGGNKAEKGAEAQPQQSNDEFAGLKQAFPDGEFIKITDNLYQANIDGKTYDGSSIEDLYKNIKGGKNQGAEAPKPQVTTQGSRTAETPSDLTALEKAYQDNNVKDYSPVKFDGANLMDIFKNLTGVYDYGHDSNGRDIGDFEDAKADLSGKESLKEGDTVRIGGKDYKIINNDGFIYVQDVNTPHANQIYILEKKPGGGYQLSQRSFTDTEGYGKAAWSE